MTLDVKTAASVLATPRGTVHTRGAENAALALAVAGSLRRDLLIPRSALAAPGAVRIALDDDPWAPGFLRPSDSYPEIPLSRMALRGLLSRWPHLASAILGAPGGATAERESTANAVLAAAVKAAWEDDTGPVIVRTMTDGGDAGGHAYAAVGPNYLRYNGDDLVRDLGLLGGTVGRVSVSASRTVVESILHRADEIEGGARRKAGEPIEAGIRLDTRDDGGGSVSVKPFWRILVCTNGVTSTRSAPGVSIVHRGGERWTGWGEMGPRVGTLASASEAIDRESIERVRAAIRSVTESIRDETDSLAARIAVARDRSVARWRYTAAALPLTWPTAAHIPACAMADVARRWAMDEHGRGRNLWGLANALTAAAHAPGLGEETRQALEDAGGEILSVTAAEWARIAAEPAPATMAELEAWWSRRGVPSLELVVSGDAYETVGPRTDTLDSWFTDSWNTP